jgi:hypothetical protein
MRDSQRRGWTIIPVSRRLTAHQRWLLGHPVPARDLGLRCLRLTGGARGRPPDPDGFSRSACASCHGGGRPLDPEASGVHTAGEICPAARQGGTGPEHWPEAMSPTSSALHPASSLAACDLVSYVLGPVIPDEQPHVLSRPRCSIWPAACGRTISALMNQCSRPEPGRRARHPSSDQLSRPAGRGTVCQQGFKAQESKVLTCRRLPGTESARWGPGRTH